MTSTFRIALTSILLSIISIGVHASSNQYKVDDDIYQQYLDVDRMGYTPRSVAIADSLARKAAAYGDVAGQCLFMSIPVKYYNKVDDDNSLEQACDRLREVSRQGGDKTEDWYFWTYRQQALHMINHGQLFSAFETVSRMREDAERSNSQYGIYETMVTVGDIYRIRNDIGLSGENYLKAYEYQQSYLPDINPAQLCAYLAEYFRRKSGRTKDDLQRSKYLVEHGLRIARTDNEKAALLTEKAMSLYSERNIREFNEVYSQCRELYDKIGPNPEFLQIKYRKCILDRDYDKAMEMANNMSSEYDREIALYVIQRAQNNYEEALKHYEKANHSLNLIRDQERRGDLSEINARLGNYELAIANSNLERQRSRTANTALVVICVIIIVALIVLIKFFRKVKRTNRQLEKSNDELREARKKAEESDRMKMMFIQNMSHEIRTPLNAIVGFANLLAYNSSEFSKDELDEFRKLINHNCDMLTILIDDILTISDLESGKYVFDFSDTPVNHMCVMAMESAKARVKPGVKLAFNTQFADDYTIKTDSIRLAQVLNNVLINACKFTETGSIIVDARLNKNNALQISVADTGPGIPADMSDVVFERFVKLGQFNPGTGLGLNICKMIMERLHGRIYLDTHYTKGARFVIEL